MVTRENLKNLNLLLDENTEIEVSDIKNCNVGDKFIEEHNGYSFLGYRVHTITEITKTKKFIKTNLTNRLKDDINRSFYKYTKENIEKVNTFNEHIETYYQITQNLKELDNKLIEVSLKNKNKFLEFLDSLILLKNEVIS